MKATYDDAIDACVKLQSAGYKSYLAGGCVRDILLGYTPSDYDVTTSANPEEVQKVLGHSIPVGESFGVIKVIYGENRELDVATFRVDGQYSDNRRPDVVQFTKSAEEDVKRRDFTINALLEDVNGNIIDHVGGLDDIKKRFLRTVGCATDRFTEDSLRMLRAIRFATKYNLDIHPDTWAAIKALAQSIKTVSVERVTEEFTKMMTGGKADKAFLLLLTSGLWEAWFGTAAESRYWLIMYSFSMIPFNCDVVLPIALITEWLYITTKTAFRGRLCLTRAQGKAVEDLCNHAEAFIHFPVQHLAMQRRMMQWEDVELCKQFIIAKEREGHWNELFHDLSRVELFEAMDNVRAQGFPDALINGQDLIEWKYVPGNVFTDILHRIQTEQLEGRMTTKEQAKSFIRSVFPAAARTLPDGSLFDGMAKRRFVSVCNQCHHTMSFDAECHSDGTINFSTVTNEINVSVSIHNYYAVCRFERDPAHSWSRFCTGKRGKHKFIPANV